MSESRKERAHRYGLSAEKRAAFYLLLKGYLVIARRYRNAQGEIDIVARRGNTLAFVEVKARQHLKECEETVPAWKQQKIARAAEGFLAHPAEKTGLARAAERNIRFDVIWIVPKRWPVHIKDAWRL